MVSKLASFAPAIRAVVIGASGGIGGALAATLARSPRVAGLMACARRPASIRLKDARAEVERRLLDLEREETIEAAAAAARMRFGALDLVLVATGLLHEGEDLRPERRLADLDPTALRRAFEINAIGPALVARHFLPLLARDRKTAFAALSARVGSSEDNRLGGWHAYRASKAALDMLIRNAAIELARRNPQALCVALHPGTVATRLSAPFRGGVPPERLFEPSFAAARLLEVLDRLEPEASGGLYGWDGRRIPF